MTNLQTFTLAALEGSAVQSYLYFKPDPDLAPRIAARAADIATHACRILNLNPGAEASTGALTLHHISQTQPPEGAPA